MNVLNKSSYYPEYYVVETFFFHLVKFSIFCEFFKSSRFSFKSEEREIWGDLNSVDFILSSSPSYD